MGKRVVFLNRFYRPDESATAQILTDLAEHLAASGWEVEVVTSRLLYAGQEEKLVASEDIAGVRVNRLWSTGFGRANLAGRLLDYLSIYFSYLVYLLLRVPSGAILVAKTDPPLMSIPCWLGKVLRGYRLVCWCQDIFPEILEHRSESRAVSAFSFLLSGLRNISLNGSDMVAVLSADMKQFLQAEGIRSPLRILPNWAISEDHAEDEDVRQRRKEWGLEDRFVLGYSGNLGRVHDWQTLFNSLEALADIPRLTLLFVGGGAGYEAFKAACSSVELPDIRFLPYQDREDLGVSLRVPDVHWLSLLPEMSPLVFPSKFYGILGAGRPCLFIGDPGTELGQLIEHEGCGVSIQPGEHSKLVEAVRTFAQDPQLCKQMGARARELLESDLSRQQLLSRWESSLADLVKISPR